MGLEPNKNQIRLGPLREGAILQEFPTAPSQGPALARAILNLERKSPPRPSLPVPGCRSVRLPLLTECELSPSPRTSARLSIVGISSSR